MNVSELVDILKHRNIKEIKYFHTDHFEPWSSGINDQTLRGLERFSEQTKKSRFTQKLSLFYLINLPAKIRKEHLDSGWFVDGDDAGFAERDPKWINRVKDLIRPLERDLKHEMHLHIHHERWTQNSGDYDPIVHAWVNENSNADKDSNRLDLGLRVARSFMVQELGRPFDSWAFVHGNWALNASDHTICKIENEIEILAKHGCWGDFTFPAGRGHCDPVILEEPYVCKPIKGIKSYDMVASEPKKISEFNNDFESNFFIWNSEIKAGHSSLDYYYEGNCKLFKQAELMVEKWLSESYQLDGVLYLKTHAHSMNLQYEIHEAGHPIPHLHPDVVNVFNLLEQVCEQAAVSIDIATVEEVRKSLLPNFLPSIAEVNTFPIINFIDGRLENSTEIFLKISKFMSLSDDLNDLNLLIFNYIMQLGVKRNEGVFIDEEEYFALSIALGISGFNVHFCPKDFDVTKYQVQLLEIYKAYPGMVGTLIFEIRDLFSVLNQSNYAKPLLITNDISTMDLWSKTPQKLFACNLIITRNQNFVDFLYSDGFKSFIKKENIGHHSLNLQGLKFESFSIVKSTDSVVCNILCDLYYLEGHCYQIRLGNYQSLSGLENYADNNEHPRRSMVELSVNGIKLDKAHSSHASIKNEGSGRYSHWKDVIYFSFPNNPSPCEIEKFFYASIEIPNDIANQVFRS